MFGLRATSEARCWISVVFNDYSSTTLVPKPHTEEATQWKRFLAANPISGLLVLHDIAWRIQGRSFLRRLHKQTTKCGLFIDQIAEPRSRVGVCAVFSAGVVVGGVGVTGEVTAEPARAA